MTSTREAHLSRLGFRLGINGPHAARTMMLDELRLLLSHTEPEASRSDYAAAIVKENVLGKATRKARDLTLRYMNTLYSLDTANPIFRAMRRLWPLSEAAQPMLALGVALARDPLLRKSQDFILSQRAGTMVSRDAIESFISRNYPDRFSQASLKSFSQNIAGTWTSAGVLRGHRTKTRSQACAHPESLTLFLFLGYLCGRTGQSLFSSEWINVLDNSPDVLESLTTSASHRGLLVYMNAGGVREIRFPGYLTPDEERIRQEISHVV